MTDLPRLRQVALVAADLAAACTKLEDSLGLRDPFHDPGVGEFGLANAVYEIGDTFVEIVSPAADATTAGRYLVRKGGDAGYMALFQVADTPGMRRRAAELGLRVVWQIDLPDIAGTHLHPRDLPGAIVSFDTPLRPETWRWGGPRWVDGAPPEADPAAAILGITVGLVDVDAGAKPWRALFDGAPQVRFEPVETAVAEGIVGVTVGLPGVDATICGVRFRSRP